MRNYDDECLIEIYEYAILEGETPVALYEHYMEDMPYGTAKARTGDPDNWLADRIDRILEDFADEIKAGEILYKARKAQGKD